ncbi:MAG: hypothetical protein B7Z40_08655 [Bosea sp. 12-68-7]|nr:MAG: hypothetical protein B7Z40_08655 [Bosea sp. 12-68-7]OYW97994.1 MAG: hypothetical protein B7Z14_16095 [Bosea sp. 32-68-6]
MPSRTRTKRVQRSLDGDEEVRSPVFETLGFEEGLDHRLVDELRDRDLGTDVRASQAHGGVLHGLAFGG